MEFGYKNSVHKIKLDLNIMKKKNEEGIGARGHMHFKKQKKKILKINVGIH